MVPDREYKGGFANSFHFEEWDLPNGYIVVRMVDMATDQSKLGGCYLRHKERPEVDYYLVPVMFDALRDIAGGSRGSSGPS